MVRNALKEMNSEIKARIIVISDDMDGLRKVPDNIPNKEMVHKYIDQPLTSIPDPFNEFDSFGEYMNHQLCSFLDSFKFEYEFKSATKAYKSGEYNNTLIKVLENHEKILDIILPTLGEERRKSYSPFLPICKKTNRVLQAPVSKINVENREITYIDPDTNEEITTGILNGQCKLQWKPDWGMRWAALGVDYEMYGKDLQPSADLSTKICRILGSPEPTFLRYELFLDKDGQKISKSKGNGLSISEWLRYGTKESLALYMYHKPQTAKRLHFDVIPKTMDEYISFVKNYNNKDEIRL